MKINELRIGNLVSHGTLHTGIGRNGRDYYTIKELTENIIFFEESIVGEYYKDVQPILLTKEWLIKFGFKYDTINYFYSNSELMLAPNKDGGFDVWYHTLSYGKLYLKLMYVHKLQNLYFELEEKELTLGDNEQK